MRLDILVSLLVLTLIATLVGCGSPAVKVTVRDIEQTALVMPPTGPAGVGPIAREGGGYIEGGFSLHTPSGTGATRAQGAGASVVPIASGHLRAAFSPAEGFEVGFHGSLASGRVTHHTLGTDTDATLVENNVAFGVGMHFRGILAGTEAQGFGLLLELDVQGIPYHRSVHETELYYETRDSKPEVIGEDDFDVIDTTVFVDPRLGLFGSFRTADIFHFSFGGMLHAAPAFFGEQRADERCTYDSPGLALGNCEGPSHHSQIAPYDYSLAFTPFATASVDVGPATFLLHLYGHLFVDEALAGLTPFGGDLRIRYNF